MTHLRFQVTKKISFQIIPHDLTYFYMEFFCFSNKFKVELPPPIPLLDQIFLNSASPLKHFWIPYCHSHLESFKCAKVFCKDYIRGILNSVSCYQFSSSRKVRSKIIKLIYFIFTYKMQRIFSGKNQKFIQNKKIK